MKWYDPVVQVINELGSDDPAALMVGAVNADGPTVVVYEVDGGGADGPAALVIF